MVTGARSHWTGGMNSKVLLSPLLWPHWTDGNTLRVHPACGGMNSKVLLSPLLLVALDRR